MMYVSVAAAADIIDTAAAAGRFNTFLTTIRAADLHDTLKASGPFTVFAPNDAAFAKLPEGTVEDLLKPESKNELVKILTYQHPQMPETLGGCFLETHNPCELRER
jgi:uncharacterized surface protein with fasciclin (FAS1) repeats